MSSLCFDSVADDSWAYTCHQQHSLARCVLLVTTGFSSMRSALTHTSSGKTAVAAKTLRVPHIATCAERCARMLQGRLPPA